MAPDFALESRLPYEFEIGYRHLKTRQYHEIRSAEIGCFSDVAKANSTDSGPRIELIKIELIEIRDPWQTDDGDIDTIVVGTGSRSASRKARVFYREHRRLSDRALLRSL